MGCTLPTSNDVQKPEKPKWRPPRVGRPNYDRFRAEELPTVITEIRIFADSMRIHEKAPGEKGGRPPASRRDLLKSLLFLEKARAPIPESNGWLPEFHDLRGPEHVCCLRTLYKYRSDPGITQLLDRAIKVRIHG